MPIPSCCPSIAISFAKRVSELATDTHQETRSLRQERLFTISSLLGYQRRIILIKKSENIVAVGHRVSTEQRWDINKHKGGVLWFTGLPGSGKSTLAIELEHRLFQSGKHTYVLDGDNIRLGLSSDLGFSPEDRTENIRRIGEVAALFAEAGFIVITAFISPYQADRDLARRCAGDMFKEVFVDTPAGTCEQRDPKGHYQLARAGKILEFTGISAPYEAPSSPDLTVKTLDREISNCVFELEKFVATNFNI